MRDGRVVFNVESEMFELVVIHNSVLDHSSKRHRFMLVV
jgi:hypothetical protein